MASDGWVHSACCHVQIDGIRFWHHGDPWKVQGALCHRALCYSYCMLRFISQQLDDVFFLSLQTKNQGERRKHLQQAKHAVSTVLEQRLSDLFNDWCGFMGKIVGSIRFLAIYMFIYDQIQYTNRWQKPSPSRWSRSWCRSYARLFAVNFRQSFIYF